MSILEELYYGNINPSEKFVKKGSEYHKTTKELLLLEEKLYKTINKEEKAIYEEISENRCRLEDMAEKERFIDGFRVGAMVLYEILTPSESQFE